MAAMFRKNQVEKTLLWADEADAFCRTAAELLWSNSWSSRTRGAGLSLSCAA
jgi:hypothetical protein